jgi:hypothetical protein
MMSEWLVQAVCVGDMLAGQKALKCCRFAAAAMYALAGGLLKLQRAYEGPDGQHQLGNDWAAATSQQLQLTDTSFRGPKGIVDSATDAVQGSGSVSSDRVALSAVRNVHSAVRAWLQLATQRVRSICRLDTTVVKNRDKVPPPAAAGDALTVIMRKLLTMPGMKQQQQQPDSRSSTRIDPQHRFKRRSDEQLQTEQKEPWNDSFRTRKHRCRDVRQQQQVPRHSFNRSRPAFGELQYNVYNLRDYDFVWDNYAYLHPGQEQHTCNSCHVQLLLCNKWSAL